MDQGKAEHPGGVKAEHVEEHDLTPSGWTRVATSFFFLSTALGIAGQFLSDRGVRVRGMACTRTNLTALIVTPRGVDEAAELSRVTEAVQEARREVDRYVSDPRGFSLQARGYAEGRLPR